MTTVLPGAVVRGSDGQMAGRVRDVYLRDRSGELAAITVRPGPLSSRNVLLPVAAIAEREGQGADGSDRPDGSERSDGPGSADSSGCSDGPDGSDGSDGSGCSEVPGSPARGGREAGEEPASDQPPHVQDTTVHLIVDSMAVRAGISAPDTGHATPAQLRLAARELGIEEAAAG